MAKRKLRSQLDRADIGEEVEQSFHEPPHEASAVFEHGHWWVTCPCGAQWDAVDTSDGFGFERVSEGDEDYHSDDGEYESNRRRRTNSSERKSCGFAIATYDQNLIEETARELATEHVRRERVGGRSAGITLDKFVTRDGEIRKAGWEQLNADIRIIERNALGWLRKQFLDARDEGHDGHNDLIGSLWYDPSNKKQMEILEWGSLGGQSWDLATGRLGEAAFAGVSSFGASVLGGAITFFDCDEEF